MRIVVVLVFLLPFTGCDLGSANVQQVPGSVPATKVVAAGANTAKGVAKCAPLPSSTAAPGIAAVPPRALDESVIRYLRCIDFDCKDALRAVVAVGPAVTPQLLQLLRRGIPPELTGELPGNVTRTVGLKAVAALGTLSDPCALDPLIGALKNPDPLLRAEVARALGGFRGNSAALTALLPSLGDPDPLVREMAVGALQKIGLGEAVAALHKALNAEPADYIRSAIVNAIQVLEAR